MLKTLNNIEIQYNSDYDVLYLKLKDSYDTYGHEDEYGIILNYDTDTREFVGVDIWDFKKKMNLKNNICIPVEIDLNTIYNQLQ